MTTLCHRDGLALLERGGHLARCSGRGFFMEVYILKVDERKPIQMFWSPPQAER